METNKREVYVSRKGFVTLPIIRGFTELIPLWNILEDCIQQLPEDDCFICGGYARYCASTSRKPEVATDIDIYSTSDNMYNKLKSILDSLTKSKHENDISLTYIRPTSGILMHVPTIQLVKPLNKGHVVAKGDRQTILKNFDFTVVRCCIMSDKEVLADADFSNDENRKILRIKNIHCPISSTMRCMKYAKKGYWIPPMHIVPLFLDWENRDQDYRNKIISYLTSANEGRGLTQEQVDELEELMRID